MDKNQASQLRRARRKNKIRAKVNGTIARPRLSVFRSNTSMYLQLVDDVSGKTLASAHSREIKTKGKKVEISFSLGKLLGEKAIAKNVTEVVFDRGGYRYHGRVKAAADGAREAGLKF